MGDPIIIWLPGTVYDVNGACWDHTMNNFNIGSWACDAQGDLEGGYDVTCCIYGG